VTFQTRTRFHSAEFRLIVSQMVFDAFIIRMKEVGYACKSEFNNRVYYFYERNPIVEKEVFLQILKRTMVQGDDFIDYYEFQSNFYDDNDNSPLYNIIEAMCEKYNGTMIGHYESIYSNRGWGIYIKDGIRNHKAGESFEKPVILNMNTSIRKEKDK